MSKEQPKGATMKMSSLDMHLSDQALAAIMMTLQKGLVEQCDVTDILRGLKMRMTSHGLFILNPPIFRVTPDEGDFDMPEGFVAED